MRKCIICQKELSGDRRKILCSNACKAKNYRIKHPNKVIENRKRHYLSHRETILRKDREQRLINPEKSREWCKNWYSRNKEYRKEYTRIYREGKREFLLYLKDKSRFNGNRLLVVKRDKNCKLCGTSNKLVVHHISGDKSQNTIDNLITLCGSCHITLHFWQKKFGKLKSIEDIVRTSMKILEWHRNRPPRRKRAQ